MSEKKSSSLSESEEKNFSTALRKLGMEYVRTEVYNGTIRLYARPQVDRDTLFDRIKRIKEDSKEIRVCKEYLVKGRKLVAGMVVEFPKRLNSSVLGILSQVARDTIKTVKEVPFADSRDRNPNAPFSPGAWEGQRGAHPIKLPR